MHMLEVVGKWNLSLLIKQSDSTINRNVSPFIILCSEEASRRAELVDDKKKETTVFIFKTFDSLQLDQLKSTLTNHWVIMKTHLELQKITQTDSPY